jgi:amidase
MGKWLTRPQFNSCLEFFPEMALERAAELDAHFAKTGKTAGPLHGIPISLKG